MTHDKELEELLHSVAAKSRTVMEGFKDKPTLAPEMLKQFIELTEQLQNVLSIILKNPDQVMNMQLAYFEDAISLTQSFFNSWMTGTPMPITDSRFSGDDWLHNPFFNLLSHQYLLATEHVNTLLSTMKHNDKDSAKRLQFFTKQYLDALSPANFAHTNPLVLAETLESRGKNLIKGLNNLLSDLEKGSSRLNIKMTDNAAYTLGENLATTPGKVVYRNEMMELIQYTPQTTKVKSIPLLLTPPWINKYYILDLSAHNSLVRWLVEQGITVFIISWVNPDASFAKKSLFDYMQEGPRTAISVIQKQMNVKKVNTLGFCIGGTLLTTLLAYNKAHKDESINSATFLASLIDFNDPGDISVFIDEQQIKKLEQEMKAKGYLAGKFMATSFNSLRANDLIWSFFIKNYLRGKDAVPFDILYWNGDSTNMPATMHSQYLRWMYLHNDLVKPGKISLNKTPIDVHSIDVPAFFLSTEKDHIAPWKSTYIGFQLMKGPKRFVLGGSGHIAGIINPPSAVKYGYRTNDNNGLKADEWLEQSKAHEGSWWPEWLKWLNAHSGKTVAAPDFSQLPYAPLMDAPGSYVFKKDEDFEEK